MQKRSLLISTLFFLILTMWNQTLWAKYQFNIEKIQATVREAVLEADQIITHLSDKELHFFATTYFNPYMNEIASFNRERPESINLDEAYKTEMVIAKTVEIFKKRYPTLIYDQSEWMFNSVGGIFANMIVLYCSFSEYIVIWGTSEKSKGKFSGYYPFMNEFDVMIRGEMSSHDVESGGHLSIHYRPLIQDGKTGGTVDTSNLKPSNVRSYSLERYTYMVSYAQGNMFYAFLPGAIMPGIFFSQDFKGMYLHFKECLKAYVHSFTKKEKSEANRKNYRALDTLQTILH